MSASDYTTLIPGYTQVAQFGAEDEYEEEEEEVCYVTLDLGPIEPTLVPSSSTYRLIGLDTSTPFLQLSGTIFKGAHSGLMGTELIFTDSHDQHDWNARSVNHVATTEQRITFKEVQLTPKNASPITTTTKTTKLKPTTTIKGKGKAKAKAKPKESTASLDNDDNDDAVNEEDAGEEEKQHPNAILDRMTGLQPPATRAEVRAANALARNGAPAPARKPRAKAKPKPKAVKGKGKGKGKKVAEDEDVGEEGASADNVGLENAEFRIDQHDEDDQHFPTTMSNPPPDPQPPQTDSIGVSALLGSTVLVLQMSAHPAPPELDVDMGVNGDRGMVIDPALLGGNGEDAGGGEGERSAEGAGMDVTDG